MVSQPSQHEWIGLLLAGVVAVAGSFAVAGRSPSFVISPIDRLIVDLTPGPVVTAAIETVGEPAHLAHLGLAIAVAVGVFGLLSLVGLRVADRLERPFVGAGVTGTGTWLLALGLTGDPVVAAGSAIPVAAVTAISASQDPAGAVDLTRRQTLAAVAGTLGVTGVAILSSPRSSSDDPPEGTPEVAGAKSRIDEVESKALDIASDDLHGLVSPIEEFYNVDIAEFDPEISAEEWSLQFTGDIDSERTISYDDVTTLPVENRLLTLRCVGERLNGRKLDTAVWTGTPLQPLLDSVDPNGECSCVMLHGQDGYYVQFPIEVLADGFLAWGMNGAALPPSHGHPVRVLIPGHWGETNVKWLTEIELLQEPDDGYWEERGWEGTGAVNTVAKLWDEGITELDDGQVELAGHAYAGTRGIDRVEVSIDGGSTWDDADLSDSLPDEDVWRQWRYTFTPDGSHEVVVAATDGDGTRQPRERSDPAPSGSSGWVHRTISG